MRSMDENYELPKTVAGKIADRVKDWSREAEYEAAVEKMWAQAERIVKNG